jgi:hypothetical protein
MNQAHSVIAMPNNDMLDVFYYCTDKKLEAEEKKNYTELIIQLHDCICKMKIQKALAKDADALEKMVHNKVINTKGHIC